MLKIVNSHRNRPVLESIFSKAAGLGLRLYLKETPTLVPSCEYWEIFKNSFFYRTPPAAAFFMIILKQLKGSFLDALNFLVKNFLVAQTP